MSSSYCRQIRRSDWYEPDPDVNWGEVKQTSSSIGPEKLSVIEEAIRKAFSSQPPTLEQELEILRKNRDDEWDTPTDFAFAFATHVVSRLSAKIPIPFLTTDDRGGIRMVWRFDGRRVIANFGPTPEARSYVYFESEIEHGTDPLGAESLIVGPHVKVKEFEQRPVG